jgi:hypothetical protein
MEKDKPGCIAHPGLMSHSKALIGFWVKYLNELVVGPYEVKKIMWATV